VDATVVTAQAALDKGYWLFEINSLAAAANQAWVASAAPAQETERVAASTAQSAAETGWADAQKVIAIVLAGAEAIWTTAPADAQPHDGAQFRAC
jgi:hypothetical protein